MELDKLNLTVAVDELLQPAEPRPVLIQIQSSGNFPDTGEYDEAREMHVRKEMSNWAAYAETGPQFDPAGNYLCGTCHERLEPDQCMWVKGPISMETGSCEMYAHGPKQEATEKVKEQFTQERAVYGEHKGGFGCHRCEYGAKAKQPDSDGRESYCSFWGVHVTPKACCSRWDAADVDAAGTSEGAEKGWDTRGRGRKNYDLEVLKESGWIMPNGKFEGFRYKGTRGEELHNDAAVRLKLAPEPPEGEDTPETNVNDIALRRGAIRVRAGAGNWALEAWTKETAFDALKRLPSGYNADIEWHSPSHGYALNVNKDSHADDLQASYKLDGRTEFRGLKISIENDKGSVRKGVGRDGTPWETKMTYPYGYIRMTEGVDGDHVDVFMGDDEDADNVYVVHVKDPKTGDYDEDKCFLGFGSADAAKKAFHENYDDPKFFGSMDTIPFDTFKEKVLQTKDDPQRISAYGTLEGLDINSAVWELLNSGTSEGAEKGWDKRGRGRKPKTYTAYLKGKPVQVTIPENEDEHDKPVKINVKPLPVEETVPDNEPMHPEPYYRGTTTRHLDDILKNGLSPAKSQLDTVNVTEGTITKYGKQHVYLTMRPEMAQQFAKFKVAWGAAKPGETFQFNDKSWAKADNVPATTGLKPVMLTLKLPERIASTIKSDPDSDPGMQDVRYRGHIDPKYISDVHILDDSGVWRKKEDFANLFATGTSEGAEKGWDTRGRGRHPDTADYDSFKKKMLSNLTVMSRTSKGIGRTADRPGLTQSGQTLADTAGQDFQKGIDWVWQHKDDPMNTPQQVRSAVESLGQIVSQGLLQPGQSMWRTWDDKNYLPANDVQKGLDVFADQLSHKLNDGSDPKDTAAWTEREFEQVHPLADGVGRTSMLLAGLISARAGTALPAYKDRKEYFNAMDTGKFSDYYKTLFAYGTSESVKRAWDTRGRKHHNDFADHVERFISHPDFGTFSGDATIMHADLIADKMGRGMASGDNYDSVERGYSSILNKKKLIYLGTNRGTPVSDAVTDYYQNRFPKYRIIDRDTAIAAESLFRGVKVLGFTGPEEEFVHATASRVPPELLTNVSAIISAPWLDAKHGRYDPDTHIIYLNPKNVRSRARVGQGPGWIAHGELTTVHEIGHSVYDNLPEDLKDKWLECSGWMVGGKDGQAPPYVEKRSGWEPFTSKWTHRDGVAFPRIYSEKSPDEDFADCFAYYLMNKAAQIGPRKKDYMDSLFQKMVKNYPQYSVESPEQPYGERHLLYDLDMNAAISELLNSGTSEGAEKGWDTRGRGKTSVKWVPDPDINEDKDFHYEDKVKEVPIEKVVGGEQMSRGGQTYYADKVNRFASKMRSRNARFKAIAVSAKKDGTYEILDGHHRWLAAKKAGLKTIGVHVYLGYKKSEPELEAAGTSEGAEKGWDTRGRGIHRPAKWTSRHWHGVDLDATLAEYHGYKGPTSIGRPINRMVERIKSWLAKGEKVKIFTARADNKASVKAIQRYTQGLFGKPLEVTNVKDHWMVDLWDDRAQHVRPNTGVAASGTSEGAEKGWEHRARGVKALDELPAAEILKEPGSAKIPDGTIRLYHYTGGEGLEDTRNNLASILEHGIRQDRAKGESYGEPSVVWGSTVKPHDFKEYVEFWVKPEEIGIGKPQSRAGFGKPLSQAEIDEFSAGNHDVTMLGDVAPERIVGVHEDWHGSYRYVANEPSLQKEIKEGGMDYLLSPSSRWYNDKDSIGLRRWIKDNPEFAPKEIKSAGTSEGAEKGWDTRGRGRHEVPEVLQHTVAGELLHPEQYHEHAEKMIQALDNKHENDSTWKANIESVQKLMANFPLIHAEHAQYMADVAKSGIKPASAFDSGLTFDKLSGLNRTVFTRMGQAGGGGHGAVGVMVDPNKLDPDKLLITRLGLMTLKAQEDAYLRTPGDHLSLVSRQLYPYMNGAIPYSDLQQVQSRLLVDGYDIDHPESIGKTLDPSDILKNDHGEMEIKYADTVPVNAITAYFAGNQPVAELGGKSAYDYLKGKVPDDKLVSYDGEGLHPLSVAYRRYYSEKRDSQASAEISSPELNLNEAIRQLMSYGTSEGVTKEWDERGRGRHESPKLEMVKGVRVMNYDDMMGLKAWKDIPDNHSLPAGIPPDKRRAMRKAGKLGDWIADDWFDKRGSLQKFFVVETQNGVVGALNVHENNKIDFDHVNYLATRPDVIAGVVKEHGVGTRLMLQAAKFAAAHNHGLQLMALGGAEGFYEKLGMHETNKTLGTFEWSPAEVQEFAKGVIN